MIKKIKEIKENKVLKVIGQILYVLLFIIVVLMLAVVALQRFSNNSLSVMGYRIFTVATGSMIPKYEVGDILLSKEVEPSTLNVGDDIVYKGEEGSFQDKMITHQIIEMEPKEDGGYKIVTKGIANTEQDPEITEKQVYGKIACKLQALSFISKAISNPYVFYFLIFIPIAIIVVKQIRAFISNTEEEDDEEEKEEK